MRAVRAFTIATLLVSLLPSSVFAESINSTVNINQSFNSSSVSTGNSSSSQVDIIMENNGERKEYHSSNGGSVHMESSDGKSRVDINNPKKPVVVTPTPSTTTPTLTPEVKGVHTQEEVQTPSVSISVSINPEEFSVVEPKAVPVMVKSDEEKKPSSLLDTVSNLIDNIFKM